jgi:uncharacterized membrane protein
MPSLTTIARGDASRVSEPRRDIARTDDEWRALWAIHAGPGADAPAVDMAASIVAAAFAGEKPTAGYTIEITEAGSANGAVRLAVEETAAPPAGVLAQVMTSPFHIVSVPKSMGDVTWASGTGDPRSSTGLEPKTASALAYLAGPFSGALILFAEQANPDVRFHAWQSIVGLGGLGLAIMGSYVLAFVALFVSATMVSVMVSVAYVIWVVLIIVWAICVWKAWSGERWKLPLVGDYAERFR